MLLFVTKSVHLIPKFIVSEVPIIPMARSMLLQILAACNKMRILAFNDLNTTLITHIL